MKGEYGSIIEKHDGQRFALKGSLRSFDKSRFNQRFIGYCESLSPKNEVTYNRITYKPTCETEIGRITYKTSPHKDNEHFLISIVEQSNDSRRVTRIKQYLSGELLLRGEYDEKVNLAFYNLNIKTLPSDLRVSASSDSSSLKKGYYFIEDISSIKKHTPYGGKDYGKYWVIQLHDGTKISSKGIKIIQGRNVVFSDEPERTESDKYGDTSIKFVTDLKELKTINLFEEQFYGFDGLIQTEASVVNELQSTMTY